MQIERLRKADVFSSDVNFGTLLYSELDGSIVCGTSRIQANNNRKHVKFYPPDCCVFTSTETYGLSIWDANVGNVIYSYKKEHLYDHAYSQYCILASFDEHNLKFYDLRSRYMINSKTLRHTVKLAWNGNQIAALSQNTIFVSDFRNLNNTVFKIENVHDFAVCNDTFYYISKEEKCNVLYSCKIEDDGKGEKLHKVVPYDNIRSAFDGEALAASVKNFIRIEKFDSQEKIDLGTIKPMQFHILQGESYIFSVDAVYCLRKPFTSI